MFILGQAPKRIGARQVFHAIEAGRKSRQLMKLPDPFANCKTEEDRKHAMLEAAKFIAKSYNEQAKTSTYEQRKNFYKEIVHIQMGYDPLPNVGDFYKEHTVTEIIRTEKAIELYGVLGKLSKREIKGIIEESKKLDCLRDKHKRRGYRFAVVEVI